jgi:hypothetical protein
MNKTLQGKRFAYYHLVFSVFLFAAFFLITESLVAQKYYTAETSFAVKLGTTKPIYETTGVLPTDADKLKERKANKPRIIPNFAGRRPLITHNPEALPKGPDPLYNLSRNRMPTNDIFPVVNIEGIDQNSSGGSAPPDVNGDIGRDYYVEIVNATFFRVFDKAGTPVSGLISANTIWSQVGQTSAGDPILLYDQAVDRWLLTEFPSNNRVLVAISLTSDPRGSWDAYAFQTPRFPDFPKYGIWGDAYYLTTNESGGNFPIYAINRDDILAGAGVARIQRLTVPKIGGVFFEVAQPVDWDGQTPPPAGSPGIVVKLNDDDWGIAVQDEIVFHEINIDWDNSTASNVEVISFPTTSYDTDGCSQENTGGFSCVPQPNGQGIDGAEWIITNKAQYRNFGTHEAFVMAFMVDVTGNDVAGIRWMEFRKSATEDWHIFQEGTVGSDDGLHRFMPSIGIDGSGNIGLAYAISGPDKFPSLRYTGRYKSDDPGIMTFTEYEFATGSGAQGFDRFGDYFSMSVDPADDATFWFAGQYLPDNNSWATRIVAFTAHRDTVDVFPLSLLSPANDGNLGEQLAGFSVFNRGLTTVFSFPIGYRFNGGEWITETPAIDSLQIDEEFNYTFVTPFTIDAPGAYPLQIATFLDNDGNKKNDTLTFTVIKYGKKDIALQYQLSQEQGLVCDSTASLSILLKNAGLDTVREVSLELSLSGQPVDTLLWLGELAFGDETIFTFPASVYDGENAFGMDIEFINSTFTDEVPANNHIEWTIIAQPDGKEAILEFTTDNFPQESTWKLFDATNTVIASGGPFADQQTTYIESFCLDPEACYTFTVYDAFGDGMSAQGVQGDFEIFNEDGVLIAELAKPNFGSQSSSQLCLTNQCLFTLQVGVEHESSPGAGDAIALGEASNNLGPVTYSINGGVTFQTSSSFPNLTPGIYDLIGKDAAGCRDTVPFEVLSCNLQTLVTTMPAIGGDVGQIHVSVSGELGQVLYSLNGGTFVTDSFFIMLEPGDYEVTVKDSAGCTTVDTVTVSTSVSTSSITEDYFIEVYPNPGKGVYQVEAIFPSKEIFLPYTMYSHQGETLLNGTIVKYDDRYKGEISISAYPPGIYYIAFRPGKEMIVTRIIKVE